MDLVLNNHPDRIAGRLGYRPSNAVIVLATHEAGHAVAILALGRTVTQVAIDGGEGAVTWQRVPPPRGDLAGQRRWLIDETAIALAGAVAEGMLSTNVRTRGLSAWSLGDHQATVDAVDLTEIPLAEIGPLPAQGAALARRLVADLRNDVDRVALELLTRGRLGAHGIVEYAPLAISRYREILRTRPPDPAPDPDPLPSPGRDYAGRFGGRFGTADRSRLLYRGPYR